MQPLAPSPRTRWWDLVGLAARLLLAVVFFVSGIVKASDPAQTKVAVRAYQLLPDGLADTVAAVLPYLEIAVAVILLLGLATRLGAVLSALLMVAFLIGVISAAARGLSIDCGCFGGGGAVQTGATEYTLEVLRDAGLLIVAAYLLVRPRSWLSVDGLARRRDPGGDFGEIEGPGDDGTAPVDDVATEGAHSPADVHAARR